MGITAVVPSTSTGASSVLPIGPLTSGALIAVTLVALLVYFELLSASGRSDDRIGVVLLMTIVPLAFTFGAIVLFESLAGV